jgi:hypothetical protein
MVMSVLGRFVKGQKFICINDEKCLRCLGLSDGKSFGDQFSITAEND